MTTRQWFFLALSIVGLVATWTFNLQFMRETGGFDLAAFVQAGYANSAAASLSNDLLTGCVAFLVFSYFESRRIGLRHWWIFPVLTFGIAFAFAFPLFLFLRERRLAQAA